MIKRKFLSGLRLVLISTLPINGLSPFLEKDWFAWENRFAVFPRAATVELRPAPLTAHTLAHTADGVIYLSALALKSQSVPRHELAHAFLAHYCPRFTNDRLVQEMFAYHVSGDYRRLTENTKYVYARAAARDLTDQRRGLNEREDLGEPVARLLLEQVDRSGRGEELDRKWKEFFRGCATATVDATREELLTWLTGAPAGELKGEEGFVLLDRISGLPLQESGKVDLPQPVGSLLKPLLLSVDPALLAPRRSRPVEEWICEKGGPARPRRWTWSEALTHSCNGFFLDAKPGAQALAQFAAELPRTLNPLSAAEAIGLLPGVDLSAREMAMLYRRLAAAHPEIVEALRGTAREGTLKGAPGAEWFVRHGLRVKTGTVRDLSERPRLGWIAVIADAWVAVYVRKATAPVEMVNDLRLKLEPFVNLRPEAADVQILGLVPPSGIEFSCAGQNPVSGESLRVGQSFSCPWGPVRARFKLSDGGQAERSYYGVINKMSLSEKKSGTRATERHARARRGSQFILHTSQIDYVLGVLASEYPRARAETLKGLALVVKANLNGHRHEGRPSCDTTHCQVFKAEWPQLAAADRARLLQAALAVQGERLPEGWYPFSLGGSEEWSQRRARGQLLANLSERDAHLVLRGERPTDCENMRNQLRLPSCPSQIRAVEGDVEFSGRGEGHGLGLDLAASEAMAAEGRTYHEILQRFFPRARENR